MNEVVRNFSECFFGYKLSVGKDELGLKDRPNLHPRIFLEKKDNNAPVMFFTFPDWYDPISKVVTDEKGNNHVVNDKKYIYEEVVIAFDPKGYDLNNLLNRAKSQEDKDMFYKKIAYNNPMIKAKGRFDLDGIEYSGVGVFVLKKDGKETIIYFAINYAPRKKIYYYIDGSQIRFETKNSLSSLKVKVLYDPVRMPCLTDETGPYKEYEVKFVKSGGKNRGSIPNEFKGMKLFVDFGGSSEEIERNRSVYLLVCEHIKNKNAQIVNNRNLEAKRICPYCHREIKMTSHYFGGMYCDGEPIKPVKFLTERNKVKKNFIVCREEKHRETQKINRILPDDIFGKRNYRIAVLGKARSGKTTYLSRLFNIGSAEKGVNINPEQSEFFRFYNINTSFSQLYDLSSDRASTVPVYIPRGGVSYFVGKYAPQEAKNFFSQFVISVADKKFIKPTEEKATSKTKTTKHPFIFEINNDAYVNVYDIAGEDVEFGGTDLRDVTQGEANGAIIVIDLSRSIETNKTILKTVSENYEKRKKNCPIAIVLTKFDRFETEFNSNCACLNSDYRSLFTKSLDDSSLIHQINTASEEIESYLIKNDFLIKETFFKGFNVKFFSVSAITYTEALYHVDGETANDEVNALNFECSQKRLELPMLWILHEFGEI